MGLQLDITFLITRHCFELFLAIQHDPPIHRALALIPGKIELTRSLHKSEFQVYQSIFNTLLIYF